MAIQYDISSANGMMTVVACGSDEDLDDVKNYGLAIIENATRLNCRKILCNELNLEYRLDVIDTYEAARFISEYAPHIARVAIVCNPRFIKDAQFWENVAVNRGLMVHVFQDLAEATRWLEAYG